MKIFFSVGEPSGDVHGANLIRHLHRLRPDIECVGYGGPRMAAAGCRLHADLTELAVMWFWRVLLNLRTFRRRLAEAEAYFREQRPDAVVLIDYPGFNWLIAKRAKRCGIPVFYYGTPQIWAWATWRVKKMRRLVDHVLCKLPFEEPWLKERGCQRVTFLGHPFFDQVHAHQLDTDFVAELTDDPRPLVAILPGSRTQEVQKNLPWFLRAAEKIAAQAPQARFAIASFNEKQAILARRLLADHHLPAEVYVGRTPEIMSAARCCLACSGSVSLELLHYTRPTVILYWIDRLAYFVQSLFVQVRFITLVNLLAVADPLRKKTSAYDPDATNAELVPFPEYLTSADKTDAMAAHIVGWLTDDDAYRARVAWLAELKARYGQPGASQRAAEYIAAELSGDAARARAA